MSLKNSVHKHQEQGISANNKPQSLQHQISNKDDNNNLPPPPVKTSKFPPLYRSKETNNKSLEMFIDKIEKDLFNPENVEKVRHNLIKDEKAALKDIRNWDKNLVRVQDKRSRFVVLDNEDYVLDNEDYVKKVEHQINRSSFQRLEYDPTKSFEVKVNTWVEKWSQMNILDEKWKSYIQTECSTSGKMYGLIKTHKTTYDIASNLPSRIKDTGHMLDIIDEINNFNLPSNSILVSFDIVNMFPSIDNKSGLKSLMIY